LAKSAHFASAAAKLCTLAAISAALSLLASSHCRAQIDFPKNRKVGTQAVNQDAVRILSDMAAAYARLSSLDMRTVFSAPDKRKQLPQPETPPDAADTHKADEKSAQPPAEKTAPPVITDSAATGDDIKQRKQYREIRVLYARPNLLNITDKAPDDPDPSHTSMWVSDGQFFNAYVPNSHGTSDLLYTKEKAPGSLRQFPNLKYLSSSSIELVLMMGVNPFANLNAATVTLSVDPPRVIRGVEADCVVMSSIAHREITTLKLYVGRADHMLYRMETDVAPVDRQNNNRIGDGIDEQDPTYSPDGNGPPIGSDPEHPLELNDISTTVTQKAVNIHTQYDNFYTPVTHVETEAFRFSPPTAMIGGRKVAANLFAAPGEQASLDPNARRLADLIRRSRKNKHKPIHDTKDVHEVAP
jgi:outer membrane lipoprotein-sorting protein